MICLFRKSCLEQFVVNTQMEDLDTLMAAVCAFIDIVGCYASQFTPDQRKRAAAKRAEVEAARLKSAATSEEAVDRAWALRQKKEQEKLVRTPPPLPTTTTTTTQQLPQV